MTIAIKPSSEWPAARIEFRKLDSLIPYARNARAHSAEQIDKIAAAIKEWGWTNPVLIDEGGGIIAGHGRVMAAHKLGIDEVPAAIAEGWSEAQKRAFVIADNRMAELATWDQELLAVELADLAEYGDLLAFSAEDLLAAAQEQASGASSESAGTLADRFLIPPFSILNAREGWWQNRKRAWLGLGIQSETGRKENLLKMSETVNAAMGANGTSIFDPVLCEIAYRWFCPPGGTILDPFAGGSVRGIVAAKLGRQYVGCDLRQEQIDANRAQWEAMADDASLSPVWHCSDSRLIDKVAKGTKADMVFSCPPYADLEQYSDDPADLSNMPYDEFVKAYREIIEKACGLLRHDSFACFVVGEVRGKDGNYLNFVGDTIAAFEAAGLKYYNEIILCTSVGSLPIRAAKMFSASRKVGKTHQNVLVFLKGDAKKATARLGAVEVGDLIEDQEVTGSGS
jgi:hypothetical protein